jgi:hypothetical protein
MIANGLTRIFQGMYTGPPLITFENGIDGSMVQDACGDRFLYALGPPRPARQSGTFMCGSAAASVVDQPFAAMHDHRMPLTAENEATVEAWLASEPPLYRLHPGTTTPDTKVFAAPSASAKWSGPLLPEVALAAGRLVQVEVVRAVEHADGHEVVVRSSFSDALGDPLSSEELKLFFRCGDPRWLEVGSRWLVPLVEHSPIWAQSFDRAAAIASGQAFFVPGLMVPARADYALAAGTLGNYPSAKLPY